MKALIAMSGGVDSSVAAYLIKKQGYEAEGAMMLLFKGEDEHTCGSADDADDARKIAQKLNIPFDVYEYTSEFKQAVIDNFIEVYESGGTPNPCIECNKHMKFGVLLELATKLGCEKLVTGHYAVIEYKNGRYLLKKAKDENKDQSYVLYSLSQQQLSKILLPLGEYSKNEIREIARKNGFVNAQKGDSQDICFIPDGNYSSVISRYTNKVYPDGDFVDLYGKVLGKHKGIIKYTIGQRKGLGLSLKEPMYVFEKRIEDNTVVLSTNEQLFQKEFKIKNFNYILFENPNKPFRAKVKIRYNQKEQWATLFPEGENSLSVVFDEPQRAIAKGQSAVAYDGDYVVGGGIII